MIIKITDFVTAYKSLNFNYDFYDNNGLYKRCQITDNATNGIKINAVANLDKEAVHRYEYFFELNIWTKLVCTINIIILCISSI